MSINLITEDDKIAINDIVEEQLCNPTIFNSNIDGLKDTIDKYGGCPCDMDDKGNPIKVTIITGTIDGKGNPIQEEKAEGFSEQERKRHQEIYWELTSEYEDIILSIKEKHYDKDGTFTTQDKQDLLDHMYNITESQRENYNIQAKGLKTITGFTEQEMKYISLSNVADWFRG